MTMHGSYDILQGDCRDTLATLPDQHFHCCVTSPPYFGLRDYGTAEWEGGDANCDHSGVRKHGPTDKSASNQGSSRDPVSRICRKCGATRVDKQIGLEPTPDDFVAAMVEVFREVRRVLRDDGVAWLNLGDSYANHASGPQGSKGQRADRRFTAEQVNKGVPDGLKPKDLIGIPWSVAFALQADGWYLRDAVIWHKPAPMPGSQRDRCTNAYEFIFQLTKNARYYFDMEAVKEPLDSAPHAPGNKVASDDGGHLRNDFGTGRMDAVWGAGGRTPRNVWTIPHEPCNEAHFATFPSAIPDKCIRASTSEHGCCPKCGAPYERITERTAIKRDRPNDYVKRNGKTGTGNSCANSVAGVEARTLGWQATCECGAGDPVPCRVVEPFCGAGTTLLAATRLGRDATGCELNPEYIDIAKRRIERALRPGTARDDRVVDSPLFATSTTGPNSGPIPVRLGEGDETNGEG